MKPGVLAVSEIKHPCVIKPAERLSTAWVSVERLAVDDQGRIDDACYERALLRQPRLISVMLANNETGVLQSIKGLAARRRRADRGFTPDAVQAVGKIPVDFRRLNVYGRGR